MGWVDDNKNLTWNIAFVISVLSCGIALSAEFSAFFHIIALVMLTISGIFLIWLSYRLDV